MAVFESKKTGDWKKVEAMMKGLTTRIDSAQKTMLAQLALKAEAMAVERIKSQPSEWKPLSPAYYEWKVARGFSNKTLIKTSSMMQAITSGVAGKVGFAGVAKNARDKEGNIIANIAAVHEYGSVKRNIPARPVWQVVKVNVVKWVRTSDLFSRTFKESILK